MLCAWTQYDQEIGYVQAMSIVASTLLLLLDGDEEVTALRERVTGFARRFPMP